VRFRSGEVYVHRPYFEAAPGTASIQTQWQKLSEEIRAYFREMNVPEGLADLMISIPPSQSRRLSVDELQLYFPPVDPVEEETLTSETAGVYALSSGEYRRRSAAAKAVCAPVCGPITDFSPANNDCWRRFAQRLASPDYLSCELVQILGISTEEARLRTERANACRSQPTRDKKRACLADAIQGRNPAREQTISTLAELVGVSPANLERHEPDLRRACGSSLDAFLQHKTGQDETDVLACVVEVMLGVPPAEAERRVRTMTAECMSLGGAEAATCAKAAIQGQRR
jgi:hypothetical protein